MTHKVCILSERYSVVLVRYMGRVDGKSIKECNKELKRVLESLGCNKVNLVVDLSKAELALSVLGAIMESKEATDMFMWALVVTRSSVLGVAVKAASRLSPVEVVRDIAAAQSILLKKFEEEILIEIS